LTLLDMGYQDYGLFIDAIKRRADFITRLKSSGSPVIVKVHTGKGNRQKLRGMRLNEIFERRIGRLHFAPEPLIEAENGVIDLDVRLENEEESAVARVVAVRGPEDELYWYLTSVGRNVLSAKDVATAYRLRWNVELFFKQLKSGAGFNAVISGRRSAAMAMLYAKVTVLCLARLLELSIEEKEGRHATTQLALVLALTRCAPLLLSMMMQARGVTFSQLEERIMLIAEITARSRSQRRERARRKREKKLGAA
jgi:IS4 transposase